MYGYEIIKEIQSRSDGAFDLKEGTLYPILHAMEKQNLLEAYWEDTDSERKRKYYRITKQGKESLATKEAEWKNFRSAIEKVLSGSRRVEESL
jgi:PadR family transcriptional regulator PadR